MMRSFCRVLAAALVLPLAGCGDDKTDDGGSTDAPMTTTAPLTTTATTGPDTPTSGTTEAVTTSTSPTTTAPDPSTTTDATTTDATTSDDTTGGMGAQCNPMIQDCPEGFKCTAYATMPGTYWDANQCVPEPADGALAGEPCMIEEDMFTGLDNCAKGFICQMADNDGKNGICVEFCNADKECPNSTAGPTHCLESANEGVLPLCLYTCDPLIQDCESGFACYGVDTFICYRADPVDNPGQDGDACNFINACVAGFSCTDKAVLESCDNPDGYGCCAAFCDTGEMNCAGQEVCNPFFPDPMPGYENVGVCSLPP